MDSLSINLSFNASGPLPAMTAWTRRRSVFPATDNQGTWITNLRIKRLGVRCPPGAPPGAPGFTVFLSVKINTTDRPGRVIQVEMTERQAREQGRV